MRARTVAFRLLSTLSIITVLSTLGAVLSPAAAQDKPSARQGKSTAEAKKSSVASKPAAPKAKPEAAKESKPEKEKAPKPPKPKKQVSSGEAVSLSREILVKHGYQVVRVETVKDAQVIYSRAGNNGRGRGQGALRKMIVRPYGNIVTFEAAPELVRHDIRMQIGF